MNRKDTILVAVLINAGVLVVLFTSALKNKQTGEIVIKPSQIEQMVEPQFEPVAIMKDEIDLAIEQIKKENPTAQTGDPIEVSPDIAQEKPVSVDLPKYSEVSVKKGDFLAKIAKVHHVSVEELMKINQLKNANLKIGQVLKIPQGGVQTPTVPAAVKASDLGSVKYYTLKPGDNPWLIAQKHKMKVEELLKLNGLSQEKAKQLKVGDKLKVRG